MSRLSNNRAFSESTPLSPRELENLYNGPVASASVMTIENTIQKTVTLFAILLAGAAVGWFVPILAFPAVVVALVLGLIVSFKHSTSVPLIASYAAFEGIAVGGISSIFESAFSGAVPQAILATLVVAGVILALFSSGKVRATPKMTKFFIVATVSYLVFSLVNLGLVAFGAIESPWGIRGVEFFGIPLGIVIGLFVVLLASYSLILDFTYIQNGVNNRVPERFGWFASFSVMVTLVWLYLEILRIIGLARN